MYKVLFISAADRLRFSDYLMHLQVLLSAESHIILLLIFCQKKVHK